MVSGAGRGRLWKGTALVGESAALLTPPPPTARSRGRPQAPRAGGQQGPLGVDTQRGEGREGPQRHVLGAVACEWHVWEGVLLSEAHLCVSVCL